jgi:hypothetical protein
MIMKKYQLLLAASVFVLSFTGCSQDELQSGTENTAANKITFVSSNNATGTRTSCSPVYTDGSGIADFQFYWEPGDKIWVDGTTQSDEPTINGSNNNLATFTATYSGEPTYIVYTGNGSTSGTSVTIKDEQTQNAYTPVRTATAHLGTDGDCGIATELTKISDNNYEFDLGTNHKASYLMLLPRITGSTYSGYKLTSIQVTADQDIAGTYTLYDEDGLINGRNLSKVITLNTGSFPLVTDKAQVYANTASYLVIAPTASTTNFDLVYTIKNASDTKHILSTGLSLPKCEADKMYYLTDNLNYSGNKLAYALTYNANDGTTTPATKTVYYAAGTSVTLAPSSTFSRITYLLNGWADASTGTVYTKTYTMPDHDVTLNAQWISQCKYYLWDDTQTTTTSGVAGTGYHGYVEYSQKNTSTAADWTTYNGGTEEASNVCKDCPSADDALLIINNGWYADKVTTWTNKDGETRQGGAWFRKLSKCKPDDELSNTVALGKKKAPSGMVDATHNLASLVPDPENYFFLPAASHYKSGDANNSHAFESDNEGFVNGDLPGVGIGVYWTKTSTPLSGEHSAYYLEFYNDETEGYAYIGFSDKGYGDLLWTGE